MELTKRQDTVVAQITNADIRDDGVTTSAKADMGRYGKVMFTIVTESSGDRNGGKAYGGGRGALEDGEYVVGTFSGRWSREGTKVTVYGIDEVTNGDMSLIVFEIDPIAEEVSVSHYALV
ncbi:MAG: hypothetical protein FI735_10315 [SAR202 cluster bacterium]|nr:hypothetical protein [SAR202 cluster bacterium]|tara:strand:- start:4 stop:363 length:360 start_codon:yes stop_codon:yes gene_type:complete